MRTALRRLLLCVGYVVLPVRSLVFAQVEAALCNWVAEFDPALLIGKFAASVKAEWAAFIACGISVDGTLFSLFCPYRAGPYSV